MFQIVRRPEPPVAASAAVDRVGQRRIEVALVTLAALNIYMVSAALSFWYLAHR